MLAQWWYLYKLKGTAPANKVGEDWSLLGVQILLSALAVCGKTLPRAR
jgi:hypothetical protein